MTGCNTLKLTIAATIIYEDDPNTLIPVIFRTDTEVLDDDDDDIFYYFGHPESEIQFAKDNWTMDGWRIIDCEGLYA